jgi:hypothetical protein
MLKLSSLILLTSLSFFSSIFAVEQIAYARHQSNLYTIQNSKSIVHWAQENLPQMGILKEGRDGFVYLKVDDGYINQLFPMLSNSEYTKPPYFRRLDSPGAHISVFYVDERRQTGEIKEIGQKFSFSLLRLAQVPPKTGKYIVLEVTSPGLEQLREKYGLSPLLKEHDFHITIAKKKERYH